MRRHLNDIAAALVLAVLFALLAYQWPMESAPDPESTPPSQILRGKYDESVVIYQPQDGVLMVTEHAPGNLLVCFTDKNHCKLVRMWRER